MSERELDAVIAAIEERDRLRQELAAALENVKDYKENSALFLRQRDEARTELAAARALLREVREWIPHYRWIPDLRQRVDAAIVEKTP